MGSLKKGSLWRIVYCVGCLVYGAWVVSLSRNNFEMVHNDYRRAVARLQPAQVEAIALLELAEQCRKKSKHVYRHQVTGDNSAAVAAEDTCRSWPETVLGEHRKVVQERLVEERSRARWKVVSFYILFGIIFLLLPPLLGYLLLSLCIWIYRNITFTH